MIKLITLLLFRYYHSVLRHLSYALSPQRRNSNRCVIQHGTSGELKTGSTIILPYHICIHSMYIIIDIIYNSPYLVIIRLNNLFESKLTASKITIFYDYRLKKTNTAILKRKLPQKSNSTISNNRMTT